jgi:hypothetical protein
VGDGESEPSNHHKLENDFKSCPKEISHQYVSKGKLKNYTQYLNQTTRCLLRVHTSTTRSHPSITAAHHSVAAPIEAKSNGL